MPQFDAATYLSQIFWLIVCFGFLCMVMASYVAPRMRSILEDREDRLQEDWNQTKALDNERESLRQENLQRLADASNKAHSLLHEAVREIHHQKSRQIGILDEELAVKVKTIRQDLGEQAQHILNDLEPLVSPIVKATSLHILGQDLAAGEIRESVRNILGKRKKI